MFGKKNLSPFILRVLTSEYLIEGTVEGDTRLTIPPAPEYSFSPLRLTDVRIQPEANPPRTCPEFMVLGHNVVAFIPRIPLDQLADYNFPKVPQKSILGAFYFGPYVMHGKLMTKDENIFSAWKQIPMLGVKVASTPWGEINAPFAIVNCRWLHGYERQ